MTNLFQRIDTVFVPTKDIEKAAHWYVDVLGGVLGWKSEQGEYQCVKFGDTSITLFLTEDPLYFQPRRCAFNFYVSRASEAYDYLKSRDVQVEEIKEYGATYFAFYDVDGNCLEVCEY
ncbi:MULTISPECIES: VOC family protein [Brevibacillus]|uniref:VOC family protein n=1 Tax=Brevibacillus invocatus TaxID=173959 RepID=A0A3M8CBU1_9BACL|nr:MULTISPECIES: VOC family protein [Brevibacillus]MDH4616633.1 VOC family protein [Brevibacillus sp. AY1]RNB72325.1 VOC family protein [Brevibacillus invocatus]